MVKPDQAVQGKESEWPRSALTESGWLLNVYFVLLIAFADVICVCV